LAGQLLSGIMHKGKDGRQSVFRKTPEQAIMGEAGKIASMKDSLDALSWERIATIGKMMQMPMSAEEHAGLARELVSIAQTNTSLLDKLGLSPDAMSGVMMPSGIEKMVDAPQRPGQAYSGSQFPPVASQQYPASAGLDPVAVARARAMALSQDPNKSIVNPIEEPRRSLPDLDDDMSLFFTTPEPDADSFIPRGEKTKHVSGSTNIVREFLKPKSQSKTTASPVQQVPIAHPQGVPGSYPGMSPAQGMPSQGQQIPFAGAQGIPGQRGPIPRAQGLPAQQVRGGQPYNPMPQPYAVGGRPQTSGPIPQVLGNGLPPQYLAAHPGASQGQAPRIDLAPIANSINSSISATSGQGNHVVDAHVYKDGTMPPQGRSANDVQQFSAQSVEEKIRRLEAQYRERKEKGNAAQTPAATTAVSGAAVAAEAQAAVSAAAAAAASVPAPVPAGSANASGFKKVYSSADGTLCLYDDGTGRLVAVDSTKLP